MKTGPSAVAKAFMVVPKRPAGLSSAPYSQPPCREVVCVPGSAATFTSKYWFFETAVGIIPSTSTTAVLRLLMNLPALNSGDCLRIYCSRYALICGGHSAEPVCLSPPTSPYPSTGMNSRENTSASDPIVLFISIMVSAFFWPAGPPQPAIKRPTASMLVTRTVFMCRISIVINPQKKILFTRRLSGRGRGANECLSYLVIPDRCR